MFFSPARRKGNLPGAFKGDSWLQVNVDLSTGGPMTALQVLRFEAALWGIAEEAVFAGEPNPDSIEPCLATEGIPPTAKPVGEEMRVEDVPQRWLDLSA